MAKYYGAVGYGETRETAPDVYEETIVERSYFGDVTRNVRRYQSGQGLNDNLEFDNMISIVADPYALQNFSLIRYATWNGAKWKVKSVEVVYPRLNLTIGGVYHEHENEARS